MNIDLSVQPQMPIRQLPRAHIAVSSSIGKSHARFRALPQGEQSSSTIKFGSLTSRALQGFFQPVTENYLAGFMAQDVIALWIPRIINSLSRGRIPYNPDSDPMVGKRNNTAQKAHELKQNIKGLNWWNGWEETGREFQSGPGFMLLNCLVFLVGCKALAGRRGLLIPYPQLKQFFGQLGKISTPELLGSIGKLPFNQQQQKVLQNFIQQTTQHHFDSKTLEAIIPIKNVANKNVKALLSTSEQAFYNWLGRLNKSGNISVGQAWDAWLSQYTQTVSKGLSNSQLNKALKPLENNFSQLIYWTNVNTKNVLDPNLLHTLQTSPLSKAGQAAESICSKAYTESLEKFSSTIDNLLKSAPQGLTPEIWQKHLQTTLDKMVSYKMPLSIIATVLGGLNHFYVSSVTQVKNRQYPANRLIRLEDLPNFPMAQQSQQTSIKNLAPSITRGGGNVL